MKTLTILFFILFLIYFFPGKNVNAQVSVTGAIVGNGSYATLTAATIAIGSGAQTGANILISITGNTTEPNPAATLDNGNWTSLLITPSGGAARTVTGSVNGNGLLILNNADNVTIDGLNTGGNSLTFSNTSASLTPGTSTIKIQNGSSSVSIKNCSILGSSAALPNSDGGNVFFSGSGNNNNLISFCNIGPAGSNLPSKCFYARGISSADTIRNCNIFDYWGSAIGSAGIFIDAQTNNFIIKDNKFYQTAARTLTTNSQHSAIYILNPSGNNFIVSGNIIGYANAAGTGTSSFTGIASTIFNPIYVKVSTTGTATSIQGNTIAGISISGSFISSGISSNFKGIYAYGFVNIGNVSGNTIGSQTDTNNISITTTSANNSQMMGIYFDISSNGQCSNNTIGGISISSTANGTTAFYGVFLDSGIITCQNNIVGGNIFNSINNKTQGTLNKTYGIYNQATGTVSGNTVRNISTAGGSGSNSIPDIGGIVSVTSGSVTVSQNIVYQLKSTNNSVSTSVTGMYMKSTSGVKLVSRNFIHTLVSNNINSYLNGIFSDGGTGTYQNNMIHLGASENGSSIASGLSINGIRDSAGTNDFYFNSVYIGGSAFQGSSNTFALNSLELSGTRNYINNIFYNARSSVNGTTGKHYAVSIASTTAITIDNNIYLANGSGGVIGAYNSNDYTNIMSWQTAVGQDVNSSESDPKFVSVTGLPQSIDLHISPTLETFAEAGGINIPSVTDDFDGQVRSSLTPVDIGADAGNFITFTISVTGLISGVGIYSSLSSAFTAINSAPQTGAAIKINIRKDYNESVTGAILNQGSWASILIKPIGTRTISSAVNPGLSLIDFNGADNVTIDGLDSAGNSLTISNTSVSAVSGTSTLRFKSDARNNNITRCTILGSSITPLTSDGGNILFASNSTLTGNDINVISFCNVGPAGSNLPSKGISSSGTTSMASLYNSSDTIRNCNIYNCFKDTASSSGIYIGTGSTNFIIKENKLYQSAARTHTVASQHSAIWISNTSGNDFLISQNIIGYASSSGTGKYTFNGVNGSIFCPIFITADPLTASSIQGNIVAGISMSGVLGGTSTGSPFKGIFVNSGLVNLGTVTGNTIGSMTDTSSITITASTFFNEIEGIYFSGPGSSICSNNLIGGITSSISGSGAILCIRLNSSGVITCHSNYIGGTLANSIYNRSTGTQIRCVGIQDEGSSSIVSANTIKNMQSDGGTGTGASASVVGICVLTSSSNHTVSQNEIYNLSNTSNSSATIVTGIYSNPVAANLISGNFIHSLSINSNSGIINGIQAVSGNVTYQNNMISLGRDSAGNSVAGGEINCIRENAGSNNFYFNSTHVNGIAAGSSANTFAFNSSITFTTRNYMNNIFDNERSNSGSTGKHYSIRVGGTSPNPAGLAIDYNVYHISGSGTVFGLYNGNDVSTLSAWKSSVGQDAQSYQDNPWYINPDGSAQTVDLHIRTDIQTIVDGNGIDIASVTDDFDNEVRNNLTPVDIGADAGNFLRIPDKTLFLTMIVQGFWNPGSNNMIQDTMSVYLRNQSSPYSPVDSTKAYLNQFGSAPFLFSHASNNTPYYLDLKHRNSIETWSSSVISFDSGQAAYNFSIAVSKAYGSNMIQVDASPLRFAMYGGDENQDGSIDVTDIVDVYNDVLIGNSGYVNTDINGDDYVDVSDLILTYNNSLNVISVITP